MALEWLVYHDNVPDRADIFCNLVGVCIDEDGDFDEDVVKGLLMAYTALLDESIKETMVFLTANDAERLMWSGYKSEVKNAEPGNCGFMWPEHMPRHLNYPEELLRLIGVCQGQREKMVTRQFTEMAREPVKIVKSQFAPAEFNHLCKAVIVYGSKHQVPPDVLEESDLVCTFEDGKLSCIKDPYTWFEPFRYLFTTRAKC